MAKRLPPAGENRRSTEMSSELDEVVLFPDLDEGGVSDLEPPAPSFGL